MVVKLAGGVKPAKPDKHGDGPREGGSSPWGKIQDVINEAPGIWFVSTAGHGGLKLSKANNAAMPEFMRKPGGWYEEDCEWAMPYVFFADELELAAFKRGEKAQAAYAKTILQATETFRSWSPDAYEQFTGETIPPGKSYVKDQRAFDAAHAGDLIVLAAWGDWCETVPKGFVGVVASKGGKRGLGPAAESYWLVADADYEARNHFGFVVEPAKCREWKGPKA